MGCCMSDSLPVVPEVIFPDPAVNETVVVRVKRLGSFGRDFAIYKGEQPVEGESMWLWFNKSSGAHNQGIIDVENFVRGLKEDKDKGGVLWSASVTESPYFEQFQRSPHTNNFARFFGFENSGYNSDDDNYFIHHPNHNTFGHADMMDRHLITKWKLSTRANIKPGDTGRNELLFGANQVGDHDIILDVFSKGTVITTYDKQYREVGEPPNTHQEMYWVKKETEFVDRIEFRLICRGMLWAQWVVPGDTHHYNNANYTMDTPLFTATLNGGWFKSSYTTIFTKPGWDPALAMLVAQLCTTEYSVGGIKADLRPNTPHEPPVYGGIWGFNQNHSQHSQGVPFNGHFTINL